MKKILSFALALAMVLAICPIIVPTAEAANTVVEMKDFNPVWDGAIDDGYGEPCYTLNFPGKETSKVEWWFAYTQGGLPTIACRVTSTKLMTARAYNLAIDDDTTGTSDGVIDSSDMAGYATWTADNTTNGGAASEYGASSSGTSLSGAAFWTNAGCGVKTTYKIGESGTLADDIPDVMEFEHTIALSANRCATIKKFLDAWVEGSAYALKTKMTVNGVNCGETIFDIKIPFAVPFDVAAENDNLIYGTPTIDGAIGGVWGNPQDTVTGTDTDGTPKFMSQWLAYDENNFYFGFRVDSKSLDLTTHKPTVKLCIDTNDNGSAWENSDRIGYWEGAIDETSEKFEFTKFTPYNGSFDSANLISTGIERRITISEVKFDTKIETEFKIPRTSLPKWDAIVKAGAADTLKFMFMYTLNGTEHTLTTTATIPQAITPDTAADSTEILFAGNPLVIDGVIEEAWELPQAVTTSFADPKTGSPVFMSQWTAYSTDYIYLALRVASCTLNLYNTTPTISFSLDHDGNGTLDTADALGTFTVEGTGASTFAATAANWADTISQEGFTYASSVKSVDNARVYELEIAIPRSSAPELHVLLGKLAAADIIASFGWTVSETTYTSTLTANKAEIYIDEESTAPSLTGNPGAAPKPNPAPVVTPAAPDPGAAPRPVPAPSLTEFEHFRPNATWKFW